MRRIGVEVLPGCGPAAVTKVPLVTSARHATTVAHESQPSRRSAIAASRPSRQSCTVPQVANVSTSIASRKWDMTRNGFRSKATVTAPSGTWSTVPAAATTSAVVTSSIPRRRRAISAIPTEASIARPEMTRFENSIRACDESAGSRLLESQVGQCGQPSPDDVSRTRPPVVTTSHRSPSEKAAAIRRLRAEIQLDRSPAAGTSREVATATSPPECSARRRRRPPSRTPPAPRARSRRCARPPGMSAPAPRRRSGERPPPWPRQPRRSA